MNNKVSKPAEISPKNLHSSVKLSASSPAFQPSARKNTNKNAVGTVQKTHAGLEEQPIESKTIPSFSTLSIEGVASIGAGEVVNHDYTMELPKSKSQIPHMQPIGQYFVDESLRREIVDQLHAVALVRESTFPYQVHNYHSLSPLGIFTNAGHGVDGSQRQMIKAGSIKDGKMYCLCRIPGVRPKDEILLESIDKWKSIVHPNIVRVYEAFTTRAFGDSSLIVVYDLHLEAATIKQRLLNESTPFSESLIWSIVIQLAAGFKAVHSCGLGVRLVDTSTILLSSSNRVYMGLCGLADIMTPVPTYNADAIQQEDLRSIGKVLSEIVCIDTVDNNIQVHGQYPQSLIGSDFSADLKQLFSYLYGRLTPVITIDDILRLAGSRVFASLETAYCEMDLMRETLSREMTNGRLVRLLCKINFIVERPEHAMDPEWSETGDRYLIKLFRDYVFHLVNDDGKPILNMAHIIGNLNKLDAGSQEKVMLMSRDEQSCLVVSYSEVKRCIEDAYKDLTNAQATWK